MQYATLPTAHVIKALQVSYACIDSLTDTIIFPLHFPKIIQYAQCHGIV